ncbi:MAG: RDD family protein [Verrucomicrobiota bacterium]
MELSPPLLASRTSRLMGQLLDGISAGFVGIFCWVIAWILLFLLPLSGSTILSLAVGTLGYAGYLLFSDGFQNGQSWGKKVFNIAVVDEKTMAPCSYRQSFIRNLTLILLNWIDWIFIFGEKRQRLGDKIAGTIVVQRDIPR